MAQIITIAIGIIIPRLVLVNLGSESNGLLNSISSILTYMSLLEAGVGITSLQALYKPIADNDKNSINGIMSATHQYYKKTGFIYLAIVIALSVGYPLLVKTSISKVYVFLVVLLAGLSGVMSYFFQGKYRILLQAEGKNYIITNITTITSVCISVSKAAAIVAGGNVVVIQSVYFAFNLVSLIFICSYVRVKYKWLDLKTEPNFKALGQRRAVLIHQITELIFNNTDVIILTAFTSLKTVSVYSMYAMIFGMVKAVAVTFSDSFSYSVGQSYSNKEKFDRIFNTYEVYNMSITFACFCIAAVLMFPFLTLYTKGVNDINYIDPIVLVLFVLFYLLQNGRKSSQTVINIAQHFEQTKWRSAAEAAINLFSSIIFTYFFGIYGVLLGTIVALLYRTNDVILYASKLLKRSPLITYKRWITNFVLFVLICYLTSKINVNLGNYINLFIYGVVLSCTVIPIFVIVNSVLEPKTAKYAFSTLKNMVLNKLHK